MVGAGLSHAMIREGGRRLPDWRRLTELMICELGKRVPEATRNKLGDLLEQSKYLAVAQEFKRSTRPDVFAQFLREQLDPPDFMQSRIHETILAIQFHGIITTNFDRVIEFHTDRFRPLVYPHFLDEPAAFQGGGISCQDSWLHSHAESG